MKMVRYQRAPLPMPAATDTIAGSNMNLTASMPPSNPDIGSHCHSLAMKYWPAMM
jgi:hypothetical protein